MPLKPGLTHKKWATFRILYMRLFLRIRFPLCFTGTADRDRGRHYRGASEYALGSMGSISSILRSLPEEEEVSVTHSVREETGHVCQPYGPLGLVCVCMDFQFSSTLWDWAGCLYIIHQSIMNGNILVACIDWLSIECCKICDLSIVLHWLPWSGSVHTHQLWTQCLLV